MSIGVGSAGAAWTPNHRWSLVTGLVQPFCSVHSAASSDSPATTGELMSPPNLESACSFARVPGSAIEQSAVLSVAAELTLRSAGG